MYVYDQAHLLAKGIRETDDYKQLKALKVRIEADADLQKMFGDYRSRQYEIQKLQMLGQPVPDELTQAFRPVHEIVLANPVLREFLEVENRFVTMMGDIQKILVDGLQLE